MGRRYRYGRRRRGCNPFSDCSSGCQVGAAVGGQMTAMLALIAGFLCIMFGFLDATTGPLRTEFGAYTESVCTIAGFKAVEYISSINAEPFIGVAAVTLMRTGETQFAAVMQAKRNVYSDGTEGQLFVVLDGKNATAAITNAFGSLQVGDTLKCGIPAAPLEPVLFTAAEKVDRTAVGFVALGFDFEEASASLAQQKALQISGFVLVAVGLLCIPVAVFGYGCCDDCCDDCECCECDCCTCEKPDFASLRSRVNTSRVGRDAASSRPAGDFDSRGHLTHYTCEYGVGPWCGHFCDQLAGKEEVPPISAPVAAAAEPLEMKKRAQHLDLDVDLDVKVKEEKTLPTKADTTSERATLDDLLDDVKKTEEAAASVQFSEDTSSTETSDAGDADERAKGEPSSKAEAAEKAADVTEGKETGEAKEVGEAKTEAEAEATAIKEVQDGANEAKAPTEIKTKETKETKETNESKEARGFTKKSRDSDSYSAGDSS